MPAKWKIFFALNLMVAIPAFIFLLLVSITFFRMHRTGGDNLFFSVFASGLTVILLNSFLNIYVLQRFFPDKLLPVAVKRLNRLSLIINVFAAIGILILCIYAAKEEFDPHNKTTDPIGKILLAIIFVFWLIQVVILTMQVRLPFLIARNNREKVHSLIDSIGQ